MIELNKTERKKKKNKEAESVLLVLITLSYCIIPFLELICVNYGAQYWINAPILGYILLFPVVIIGCDKRYIKWGDVLFFALALSMTGIMLYHKILTYGIPITILYVTVMAIYETIIVHRVFNFLRAIVNKSYVRHFKVTKLIPKVLIILVPVLGYKNDYLDYLPLMTMTFLCLFSSSFSKVNYERVMNAIMNGLIIAFFIIQGLALVFRPYDVIRYAGLFSGSASNSMFYSLMVVAWLGKAAKYRGNKVLHGFFYECAILTCSLCILTISRISICCCLVSLVIYNLCIVREEAKACRNFLRKMVALPFILIISTIFVYAVVRYTPPIFHHPIWFGGEYSVERVHSFDDVTSEKYVSFKELIDAMLGRFSVKNIKDVVIPDEDDDDFYMNTIQNVDMVDDSGKVIKYLDGIEPGRDACHPIYIELRYDTKLKKVFRERYYIYKEILSRIYLFGERRPEYQFLWLTNNFCFQHAHNDFLQIAYNYGVISAIFLYLVYFYCLLNTVVCIVNHRHLEWINIPIVLLIGNYVLTGIAEVSAVSIRMLPFIMYVVIAIILTKEDQTKFKKIGQITK